MTNRIENIYRLFPHTLNLTVFHESSLRKASKPKHLKYSTKESNRARNQCFSASLIFITLNVTVVTTMIRAPVNEDGLNGSFR